MTSAITPLRLRAIRHGLSLVGLGVLVAIVFYGPGSDTRWYWHLDLAAPYAGATQSLSGETFRYGPPFVLLFAPAHLLPFDAFRLLWLAVEIGCLYLLAGRWTLAAVALYPVALELSAGNINLPLALAVAAGIRYPAVWSFVLLSKVTPGVGILWFAVRGEWRRLGRALATTGAIMLATAVVAAGLWSAWIAMLATAVSLTPEPGQPYLAVPLALRLPAAVVLVTWGARTNRPWLAAVAATLALPTVWPAALSMLLAAVPLQSVPTSAREPGFRVALTGWRFRLPELPAHLR